MSVGDVRVLKTGSWYDVVRILKVNRATVRVTPIAMNLTPGWKVPKSRLVGIVKLGNE